MAKIIELKEILRVLPDIDVVGAVEKGFIAYSNGLAVVPPVGELLFKDPPGEVHIKYGYIRGGASYVIKIASGFYENPSLGLSSSEGLMLVFDQRTGRLEAVLLDECHLTNVRTAAAGAITARYLAPSKVERIGILGAGVQGRMQLEYTGPVVGCSSAVVWGQNEEELDAYKKDMEKKGFSVATTLQPEEVAERCRLIVTATPAKKPLLFKKHIRKGTHITAMGSDTTEKQELDTEILGMADLVVADSIAQCLVRGEIVHAVGEGDLKRDSVLELGQVIQDPSRGRTSDDQITVADLTGVAVQDIQIAEAVYHACSEV